MLPQEAQDLLAQSNHAIVAVNRAGDAPQVTPVWYLWDGDAFYVSTTDDRAKIRNIRHDPAIAMVVDDAGSSNYVAAYGQAQVIERDQPDFDPLTRRIIGKYVPAEQQEQTLSWALAPGRVVLKLRPDKVVVSGKVVELTAQAGRADT